MMAETNADFKNLPTPFDELGTFNIMTQLDILLMELLGSVKDKPHWKGKVRDEKVREKYRQEMEEQLEKKIKSEIEAAEDRGREMEEDDDDRPNMRQLPPHLKLNPKDIVDYVIRELVVWANKEYDHPQISVGPVDGVYMADHQNISGDFLLSEEVRAKFAMEAGQLEDGIIKCGQKDYHPGSDDLVVDIIHPSLYCLVSGVSMRHKKEDVSLKMKKTAVEGSEMSGVPCSQCLKSFELCERMAPTQAATSLEVVEFEERFEKPSPTKSYFAQPEFISHKYQWLPSEVSVSEEGRATIESYINNLHPRHHQGLYEQIEQILSAFMPLFNEVLRDVKIVAAEQLVGKAKRVDFPVFEWYDREPQYDDENYWNTRTVKAPPLPKKVYGSEVGAGQASRQRSLSLFGRHLQVIVKMANIELTPEKPDYSGGVWHVEGMRNEGIVATGIYYYDNTNITESKLEFRMGVAEEFDYEQNDNAGVKAIYGIEDEAPLNQQMGYVSCFPGRMIAFPNLYQHKVSRFSLLDRSQPGHRKILVFFLIDPSRKVLSTQDIPPQQLSWWSEAEPGDQGEAPNSPQGDVKTSKWPVSVADAKLHREEMMKERKFFIQNNNENLFERPFSLCEH